MAIRYFLYGGLLFFLLAGPVACRKIPGSATTVTPTTGITADTATHFQNPLLASAPDPWVIYHDGFYYVMHTTGNDLRIYKTAKMSQVGRSTYRSVWSPPGNPVTRDVWAPELHRTGGKWYIYYAAVVAPNTQHRMYVLENEAADPMAGTWVSKGQVQLAEDKWAIDGTLLNLNGRLYFAWSGWETAVNTAKQNIYLSRMHNPWTADGPRVLVSAPELDWEKHGSPDVNEGPEFLMHGNKIFLIYSASHCSTDAYALGMLTADTTADLTKPNSWVKSTKPVFGPYTGDGAFGVGHNGFFTTPDGKESWLVYHANPQASLGCVDRRSMRMQPFTWNADGSPNFGKPRPLTERLKRPSGE